MAVVIAIGPVNTAPHNELSRIHFQVETGEADSWQACREAHLGFPAGTFGIWSLDFLIG